MAAASMLRAVRRVDLDVPVILMSGDPIPGGAARGGRVRRVSLRHQADRPLASQALVQHAARADALARLRREAFSISGAHAAGASIAPGSRSASSKRSTGLWMAFQPIVARAHRHAVRSRGADAIDRALDADPARRCSTQRASSSVCRSSVAASASLCASSFAERWTTSRLFINLHPGDMLDVDLIDDGVAAHQIASRVVLEVTERASLETSHDAHRTPPRVRAARLPPRGRRHRRRLLRSHQLHRADARRS